MMLTLRLALLLAGFAAMAAAVSPSTLDLMVLGAGLGASAVAIAFASSGKGRPASDLVAWLAAMASLATVKAVDADGSSLALLTIGIVGLVAGLHVPSAHAPLARGVSNTWILAGTTACLLVWVPILAGGGRVAAVDPLSAPGAAIRMVLAVVFLAIAAGLLSWVRGAVESRQQRIEKAAPMGPSGE